MQGKAARTGCETAGVVLTRTYAACIAGVDATVVTVEADVGLGLPGLTIVGRASGALVEARERVRSALGHCGHKIHPRKQVVNLAPGPEAHRERDQVGEGDRLHAAPSAPREAAERERERAGAEGDREPAERSRERFDLAGEPEQRRIREEPRGPQDPRAVRARGVERGEHERPQNARRPRGDGRALEVAQRVALGEGARVLHVDVRVVEGARGAVALREDGGDLRAREQERGQRVGRGEPRDDAVLRRASRHRPERYHERRAWRAVRARCRAGRRRGAQ